MLTAAEPDLNVVAATLVQKMLPRLDDLTGGLQHFCFLGVEALGQGDCLALASVDSARVLQDGRSAWTCFTEGSGWPGRALRSSCTCCRGARTTLAAAERLCLQNRTGCAKLCSAPITARTCELDDIVPVRQAHQRQVLELQALCFECHKVKTRSEGKNSTTLESRFCRYVYQNYAASSRLLPLCQLQKWDADAACTGWPTLASPFLSSVPSTASTAADGFWTGCPVWAGSL
ncbi:hypothetical protein AK812_SmicGene29002 [Symbiodinium microadriaticum]|uniref:HNH domain-containing protein n=1 Tax=Symbiodinium microadriaticum TaxID=2951 RepID=A0A1Q9D2Z1_SYMMI|nr:hypothetical protein AK812_SmicGene29002 [Symbiodinium microadriaticum]